MQSNDTKGKGKGKIKGLRVSGKVNTRFIQMICLVTILLTCTILIRMKNTELEKLGQEMAEMSQRIENIKKDFAQIEESLNKEIVYLQDYNNTLDKKLMEEIGVNAKLNKDVGELISIINVYKIPLPESQKKPASRSSIRRDIPVTQRHQLNYYKINQPSGITLRDAQELCIITGIGEEHAQTLWETDQRGVNAFFTLGVAMLESSAQNTHKAGQSRVAKRYNNLFGATGSKGFIYYNDFGHSISKFADFIESGYFQQNRTTLSRIQPKYCPPNNAWDEKVAERRAVLIRMFNQNMGISA